MRCINHANLPLCSAFVDLRVCLRFAMLFCASLVALLFLPEAAFAQETGYYRPGQAYHSVTASDADSCLSHCQGDGQCRAWNYIKPNPQAIGVCEFLTTVSAPVSSAFSVSGVNVLAASNISGVNSGQNIIPQAVPSQSSAISTSAISASAVTDYQRQGSAVSERKALSPQQLREQLRKNQAWQGRAPQGQERRGQTGQGQRVQDYTQPQQARQTVGTSKAFTSAPYISPAYGADYGVEDQRPANTQDRARRRRDAAARRTTSGKNISRNRKETIAPLTPPAPQSAALGGFAALPLTAPSFSHSSAEAAQPRVRFKHDLDAGRVSTARDVSEQAASFKPALGNSALGNPVASNSVAAQKALTSNAINPNAVKPNLIKANNAQAEQRVTGSAALPRLSATNPVTHENARAEFAKRQADLAAIATGNSLDPIQKSLYGSLHDDVAIPAPQKTIPDDEDVPIITSASRPVLPVQSEKLEGLTASTGQDLESLAGGPE